MVLQNTVATVFGGSGFVGRYVVQRLAKAGVYMRVPTRNPAEAAFLRSYGVQGQVTPVLWNSRDSASIASAVRGSSIVINLVGILSQTRANQFERIQRDLAGHIARHSALEGVERLIHVSAIGATSKSASLYARSKAEGEALVRRFFPDATIVRPSVVFGAEDEFFNRFAALASVSPFLPLIGGGKTKFQPVFVGDVADAVMAILQKPDTAGKLYELGGPEVYTFRQVMDLVMKFSDRKRMLIPVPWGIAKLQARFLELLPNAPLTRDQLLLLRQDNVVASDALTFADLDITPTVVDLILPRYLDRFRKGGRFNRGSHGEQVYS